MAFSLMKVNDNTYIVVRKSYNVEGDAKVVIKALLEAGVSEDDVFVAIERLDEGGYHVADFSADRRLKSLRKLKMLSQKKAA